uniref:Uncharacterized protein n=1 Tax=Sphaerodactylus townsendi TaxID=933632 RepID=A0ACB8FJH0_9SAUR
MRASFAMKERPFIFGQQLSLYMAAAEAAWRGGQGRGEEQGQAAEGGQAQQQWHLQLPCHAHSPPQGGSKGGKVGEQGKAGGWVVGSSLRWRRLVVRMMQEREKEGVIWSCTALGAVEVGIPSKLTRLPVLACEAGEVAHPARRCPYSKAQSLSPGSTREAASRSSHGGGGDEGKPPRARAPFLCLAGAVRFSPSPLQQHLRLSPTAQRKRGGEGKETGPSAPRKSFPKNDDDGLESRPGINSHAG